MSLLENETTKSGEKEEVDEYIVRSTVDPDYSPPNICQAELLAKKVSERDPDAIAIIDPYTDLKITFGEVHRQAQEFASALVKLGVTKQDVVCTYADNSVEFGIAMAGIVYLGLTMGPNSPFSRKFDVAGTLENCGATVLLFGSNKGPVVEQVIEDEEFADAVGKVRLFVEFGVAKPEESLLDNKFFLERKLVTFQQALEQGAGSVLERIPYFPVLEPSKEHFYYVSTSGTTGPPKRLVQSHRSFMAICNGLTVPNGKVWPLWVWLGHSIGTVIFQYGLISGATQVMISTFTVDSLLQMVEKYKMDSLVITSDLANVLVRGDFEKKYDLSSLDNLAYGGGKIAPHILHALRDKFKAKIANSYGSMECFGQMRADVKGLDEEFIPGNCGHVNPGVEMKIIDLVTKKSLPHSQEGEVCFRAAQCLLGYLDNEKATKETIDEEGWCHTGDIGYYDQTGALFITDRIKEMIKYRPFSIIPSEIEDFLQRHEAVAAACVVGVPHSIDLNWIRAYVELVPGKTVTEKELVDYVYDNLGAQKRLRAGVRFIAEMPRSPVGKITRNYFKELVKDELIEEIEPFYDQISAISLTV